MKKGLWVDVSTKREKHMTENYINHMLNLKLKDPQSGAEAKINSGHDGRRKEDAGSEVSRNFKHYFHQESK